MTPEQQSERLKYIDDLQRVIDWLRANATAEMRLEPIRLNIWPPNINDKEDSRRWIANMARALGRADKKSTGSPNGVFYLSAKFGNHRIEVNVGQESVCERVEVGTREVEAIPAIPAHVEPVYEWRCSESILSQAKKDGE